MALAEIQALKDLAKEMGIEEGPELTAFLRDERDKAREMRQAEQEKLIELENSNKRQIIGLANSNKNQLIGLENCNKKQTTRTEKQPIGLEIRNTR